MAPGRLIIRVVRVSTDADIAGADSDPPATPLGLRALPASPVRSSHSARRSRSPVAEGLPGEAGRVEVSSFRRWKNSLREPFERLRVSGRDEHDERQPEDVARRPTQSEQGRGVL
jgi:hypothetical protein